MTVYWFVCKHCNYRQYNVASFCWLDNDTWFTKVNIRGEREKNSPTIEANSPTQREGNCYTFTTTITVPLANSNLTTNAFSAMQY